MPNVPVASAVRLGRHGAPLVGSEVVQYGDAYRLCYVRGPEGARDSLKATDATHTFVGHMHHQRLYYLAADGLAYAFKPTAGVAIPVAATSDFGGTVTSKADFLAGVVARASPAGLAFGENREHHVELVGGVAASTVRGFGLDMGELRYSLLFF